MTQAERDRFILIYGYDPEPPAKPSIGDFVKVPFNRNQLASWDQAQMAIWMFNKTLCTFPTGANPRLIGGGVAASDGLYIPAWSGGPAGFVEPNETAPDGTRYLFYHLRFVNGFEGVNVGLVIDLFSRYPSNPDYPMRQLAAAIEGIQNPAQIVAGVSRQT